MLSPLPRRSDWKYSSLDFPAVSAFPERVVGSACASTFSRLARCSLTLRPAHSLNRLKRSLYIGGSSHLVTSMTAPIASGRNDLAGWVSHPLVKRRLCTAHTPSCRSRFSIPASQSVKSIFCELEVYKAVTGDITQPVGRCRPQHAFHPQAVEDFLALLLAITASVLGSFSSRTILVGGIKPSIYENFGFFRGD